MKSIFRFIVLLAITTSACKNKTKHQQQDDPHQHGEVRLQHTVYSEHYELFVETDPFAIGMKNTVLAHITKLSDFKPIDELKVKAQLNINGKMSAESIVDAEEKGIFHFELTPQTTGEGELLFTVISKEEVRQIIIKEIKVFADKHDAIHEVPEENVDLNDIVFFKQQSWKIDFRTETALKGFSGQLIKSTGRVKSTLDDESLIIAKSDGIVQIANPEVEQGASVASRQTLMQIVSKGLAKNNLSVQYAEAKNNYTQSKNEYDRAKELAADKIISSKELQKLENTYKNAQSHFENLSNNFNKMGQSIRSPHSGIITEMMVQNGQYVSEGQAIMRICKNKSMLVELEIQQKYAKVLNGINDAVIFIPYLQKRYSLSELSGHVHAYTKLISADNYLIPVHVEFQNNGDFIHGAMVEVNLKTAAKNDHLSIPSSALTEEQGVFYVYVQINPEIFQKRAVKIGSNDGLRTEIIQGLSIEERFVSEGAVFIKLAQGSGTLDAHSGHAH